MKRILVSSILVLSACATTQTSAPPPIWVGLTPGQYSVGFRSVMLTTEPHPLQISAWYPAAGGGTPLTYRDFLIHSLTETRTDAAPQEEREKIVADAMKFLTSNGVSTQSAQALIAARMYARRDARPVASQRFPLVFVTQGNGQSASGQAVLSEYLASHGYVVATIPSITRITGPMQSDKDVGPKAELEAVDIERAVNEVSKWPNVAQGPVTLVAHSFGSRSAFFYAMHHPTAGLVSLEGGIGTATAVDTMLNAKMIDLRAPMPPILHFYELNDDRLIPDFKLLRSTRSPDVQLVRMNSLKHVHFSSDGFAAAMLPDMAKATKAGAGLREDVNAYAQQTLAFIEGVRRKARGAT